MSDGIVSDGRSGEARGDASLRPARAIHWVADGITSNAITWEARAVASSYAKSSWLLPSEVGVIATLWSSIAGRSVLDIGVGAGRTVPYLASCAHYVGVDLSSAMVEACRRRHPGIDVRQDDARRLATIEDASFDVVLIPYNSIDYVPPEDRAQVYAAARRVLKTGGTLAFSSHNLNVQEPAAFRPAPITLTADPVRLAARVVHAARATFRGLLNRHVLSAQERRGNGWALVNDGAYDWSLLTTYVDPVWQCDELARAGFADVRVIGARGVPVEPTTADPWPWFLAKR